MKKIRLLSLFLCLLILFTACQTGGGTTPQETTPEETTPEETTPEETTPPEPEVPMLDLSDYRVIIPTGAASSFSNSVKAAVAEWNTATGKSFQVKTDLVLTSIENENLVVDEYEILVGATNRLETAQVKESVLGQLSYTIKQTGKKVVIYGPSEEAALMGLEYFIELVTLEEGVKIAENYLYEYNFLNEMYPESSAIMQIAKNYRIVYPTTYHWNERNLASVLKNDINELLGASMKTKSDATEGQDKEILIGFTSHVTSDDEMTIHYYDYKIYSENEKIVILAGSEWAMERAIAVFFEGLKENELTLGEIDIECRYEDWGLFNPIAKDLSLFHPVWENDFTPPAWMLDFNEKAYALTCPENGDYRITSKLHRGDRANYPDGSLEAYASGILAGIDCIEFDTRVTKDGIAVLMHDASLARTTNAESFAGKNGFPSSLQVTDWTYAQLKELNLTMDNGAVTPYKICTLYEILHLVSGRVFIQVDDKSRTMVDADNKNLYSINEKNVLFYMAADTNSKECFIYWYGQDNYTDLDRWVSLDPYDADFIAFYRIMKNYDAMRDSKGAPYVLREDWWPDGRSAYGSGGLVENQTEWLERVSEGKLMLWTENPMPLCKYIAEHYDAEVPPTK